TNPHERRELHRDFFFYSYDIVHANQGIKRQSISYAVSPFTQIKMKADAELRVLSGIESGGLSGRPSRHQACARDDAMLMRFDNALVDSGYLTEIVRINDKVFFTMHKLQSQILQDFG